MFDKYEKYGAYHWRDIDSSSFCKTLRRSLPLYTRYQKCLQQIPANTQYAVEIGCGDGALSYLIAKQGVKRVLGCDTNMTGIALAKEQTKDLPFVDSVRFECSLFQDCNIKPDSVDVVILADVIEHLENPVPLLEKIKSVVKPGGKLIMTTPRSRGEKMWDIHHAIEYTEESLRKLLHRFFPETFIRPFMPMLPYRIYNYSVFFRLLFNSSAMLGFNPFNFYVPGHHYVMLISVSCL